MQTPNEKQFLTFASDQVQAVFAEFQGESDRAAAVLSMALLDTQLEEIVTVFAADETTVGDLVRPEHPLGSFGARRRVALAFGLISPEEANELATLAKIRNAFAHRLHGLAFDVDPVASWIDRLELPTREHPQDKLTPRDRFMVSVSVMHFLLSWRFKAAKVAKRTPAPETDVPLHWPSIERPSR